MAVTNFIPSLCISPTLWCLATYKHRTVQDGKRQLLIEFINLINKKVQNSLSTEVRDTPNVTNEVSKAKRSKLLAHAHSIFVHKFEQHL